MVTFGFWRHHTHNLARMNVRQLIGAYFTYASIQTYLVLAIASLYAAFRWTDDWRRSGSAALLAVVIYPVVWYLLHRFVLHGKYLYKSPLTAKVWKRIHFDHHQDPHNLQVLFGALYTTLPTISGITIPLGYLIGGWGGGAACFASGLLITCFYEFCHCIQHLNFSPKFGFLQRMKRLHLAHHFHNEQGNYGITNYWCDQILGTYYAKAKNWPKSATVFNLGYTEEEAKRYPWVAALSHGTRGDGNPRRFRVNASHS